MGWVMGGKADHAAIATGQRQAPCARVCARWVGWPRRCPGMKELTLTARDVAVTCARLCEELKAEEIAILDIRKLTQIADFFVLATGTSARQLKAVAERLRLALKKLGAAKLGIEGDPASGWLLLDYCDVVVHLFSAEARVYYQLEMLWGDAPQVEWHEATG